MLMYLNRIQKIGPWLLSSTSTSEALSSLLLIKNAKRYARFEVKINTELLNLNVLSFILLVEVAIADPINPVLFKSTKNILKKFP